MEDSLRDYDKQTEDLLMPKYYFIELLQDGSFPKSSDQVLYISPAKIHIILYNPHNIFILFIFIHFYKYTVYITRSTR